MPLTRVTREATTFAESDNTRITAFETATGTIGSGNGLEAIGGVPQLGGSNTYLMSNGDGTLTWAAAAGSGATTFDGLTDCESFATAAVGEVPVVNENTNGLVWAPFPADPITEFTGLADTPVSWPTAGTNQVWLRQDPNGGNRLVWSELPASGATDLNGLTDVNLGSSISGGDVLTYSNNEWVNLPPQVSTPTFETLSGGPGAHTTTGNDWLRYDQNLQQLVWTSGVWPTTFSELADCDSIVGSNNKYLTTSDFSGTSRVVLTDPPFIPLNLDDLQDTPNYPSSGSSYYLRYTYAGGSQGLTWAPEAFTGATQFSELLDGPIDTPNTGDLLVWGGSRAQWDTPTAAGIPQSIIDLESSLSNYGTSGQVLGTDGSQLVWVNAGGGTAGASAPPAQIIAVTSETGALTTGNNKVTFRAPQAMTLSKVKASLTTASTSGNVAIDVNLEGTGSIFSTPVTIDANEKTSETALTASVLSTTAIPDDAELTIDVDAAGTGAVGLKVYLIPA